MRVRKSSKYSWKYYDFTLSPYLPIESCIDKFSSEILFKKSFLGSSCEKSFLSLIDKIHKNFGRYNSFWRVKLERGRVTWELYFLLKNLNNSRKEITNILKILRSHFKIPRLFLESHMEAQPWHAFSVDLSEKILLERKMQGFHVTVNASSGEISYYWDRNGYFLENYYDFALKMPQDLDNLINRVQQTLTLSLHCSNFLKHKLVFALISCKYITLAIKRDSIGFYFRGIKYDQFLFFVKFFIYPENFVNFVESNKEKLDHLLYDVSFDSSLDPRKLVFSKSSFYAVF